MTRNEIVDHLEKQINRNIVLDLWIKNAQPNLYKDYTSDYFDHILTILVGFYIWISWHIDCKRS